MGLKLGFSNLKTNSAFSEFPDFSAKFRSSTESVRKIRQQGRSDVYGLQLKRFKMDKQISLKKIWTEKVTINGLQSCQIQ